MKIIFHLNVVIKQKYENELIRLLNDCPDVYLIDIIFKFITL